MFAESLIANCVINTFDARRDHTACASAWTALTIDPPTGANTELHGAVTAQAEAVGALVSRVRGNPDGIVGRYKDSR